MHDPAEFAGATGAGVPLAEAALAQALRESGASVGIVYLMDADGRGLRLAFVTGTQRQVATPWAQLMLDELMPVPEAVRGQRLVWAGSAEEVARRYPRLALALPFAFALAAVPVTTGGTRWGGAILLWPGAHAPRMSTAEQQAVEAFSRRLADILRLAADSGDPVRAGSTPHMSGPARGVHSGPGEATAVDFIDRLPGGSLALDQNGRIALANPAAADLLGVGTDALLGALLWEAVPWLGHAVVEDHYQAAAIGSQPLAFHALRPPDRWLSFSLYPDPFGMSVRVTPIAAPEIADVPRAEGPAPWSSQGSALLYPHLMALAATLAEAVGVQDVIDQTAEQIMPAMNAQALALMTAEEGRMRVIGHLGCPDAFMERIDGGPLSSATPGADVLATGVPRFFTTFAEVKAACPAAVDPEGMVSWAFLPLIVPGRTLGTLMLAYDHTHPFPPGERAILTSLAGLIATALDRAGLYDAKQQLVRSLQAGLLPHRLPRLPGLKVAARYLPATRGLDIGGDFYDLIHLDGGTAGAVIGDVQGHNSRAAALMGQVRTAVRAYASAGSPPEEVLARTNRLLADLDSDLFTSCLYVQLDLVSHRARLATAGHPPPVLRERDGATRVIDVPPGLLLGIDPAAEYAAIDISLPPGSVLALFTDGLVEAPGTDLGAVTAGLLQRLAKSQPDDLGAVADSLVQYAPGHGDDKALLLLAPDGT